MSSGQTLVRMARQGGEGQDAASAARTSMILKAPAAGVVTRSTAVVGATASPMQNEPLFRIAVDNEIELEAEVPSIHAGALSPGETRASRSRMGASCRVAFAKRRQLSISERSKAGHVSRSSATPRCASVCLRAPPLTQTAVAEFQCPARRYNTEPRAKGPSCTRQRH